MVHGGLFWVWGQSTLFGVSNINLNAQKRPVPADPNSGLNFNFKMVWGKLKTKFINFKVKLL